MFDTVENRTRLPSALGQILQRYIAQYVSLALVLVWGVPDLSGDGGIQRQMLSPGSLQGWGSSGGRDGKMVERDGSFRMSLWAKDV